MTELNIKPLENILKALKSKPPQLRVGILGGGKRSDGETNASIGARHEFGSPDVPQRSFLRVPIFTQLQKKMDASGAFDKEAMDSVVKLKSIVPWLQKIGVLAEAIVAEGFDTSGYGLWAPWSPGYSNNTGMILVDTQQLRNSITSEIV